MAEPFNGTINYWILQTAAMMLTALLIPNLRITSIFGALLVVFALGLVNATVWDAALFFQMPQAVTTQALVLLVANGAIFWVLVKILPGIEVDGVVPALVAPVVFTVISLLVSRHGRDIDWLALLDRAIAALEGARGYLREVSIDAPANAPPR
jgi:putative membrane protein